jgi:hypothetical protein
MQTSQKQTSKNPTWWNKDNDSSWDRVKAALKRDWDQTKHDVGGDEPDTDQQATDTVKQASGKEAIPARGEPTFDKAEPAYRFGVGARSHYGKKYTSWTPALEGELRKDWGGISQEDWDANSHYVKSGYNYKS